MIDGGGCGGGGGDDDDDDDDDDDVMMNVVMVTTCSASQAVHMVSHAATAFMFRGLAIASGICFRLGYNVSQPHMVD